MFQDTPDLPEGFDGEVRLFPLPDLVLFPWNAQALHIFESRYCEMLEDAIHKDRLICMATLEPGYHGEYYGRPPIAPQVCIGQVNTHRRRDDGTYDLMLVGYWRALITGEVSPVRSYRRATVQVLSEDVVDAAELAKSPHPDLVARLAGLVPFVEELAAAFEAGDLSLNGLTDMIAFRLPLEQQFKLNLLGEPDVMRRAQLLLATLPNLGVEASGERGTAADDFPPPFSAN